MEKYIYSWILPIYNEAESLPQLLSEISIAMKGENYEIVAINDGSTDESALILKEKSKKYPLKFKSFNNRRGKWEALREGIELSLGQYIITSDSDLQDDPKEISKLLRVFETEKMEVVSGWRKSRQDTFYKTFLSFLGNRLVSLLTKKRFYDLNSPFKIYKKEVLDKLPKTGSLLRFSLLFADKLGYKVSEVPIVHRKRVYGKSKFGVIKYFRILFDLILVLLLFSGSGRLLSDDTS